LWRSPRQGILVAVPVPSAPLADDYAPTPYWWDELEQRRPRIATPARQVDAAVIGGGLTGLAAALELARSGCHVVVLERDIVGQGASGRNGGMVHPGVKVDVAALASMPGGRALWDETVAAFEGLGALVGELGIDCAWHRCGHVELAHHGRRTAHLRSVADAYTAIGERADFLNATEVRDEVGSSCFSGGLVVHRSAGLHPGRFAAGLAAVAESAGAVLHDYTEVLAIERAGAGHVVRTSRGPVRAREVVMATNGTTDGRLVPWLGRRVLGVGSFMVATEPLDPSIVSSVSPNGRMLFDTRNFLHYWRPSPDARRILFGGRTSFAPVTVDRARDELHRALVAIHPQLAGVRVARAWGGQVALTADRMPHVGRHAGSGVVYAMGYCGTGVALSTHFGRCVGRWLAGTGDLPAFAGRRWPPVPSAAQVAGFLSIAGWWFRARDVLGR
jgi:glycine/D-amino acid oxidase-like deaminating enzyme